ncbi:MAG: monomethylamine:corrinoid methyltransferase [Proteobacteria bacterium]|nr:monomethylamine:corrinoid methyltransferase [Pseudomonadota bacterium]
MINDALEFYERALRGERIKEKAFDTEILPAKLKELTGKYEIFYNREDVVPQDLDMAKRVFQAALELLSELGVYCTSTNSTIRVEKEDIKGALRKAPSHHIIGKGTDEMECHSRNIGDSRMPIVIGGPNGAPISEENCINILTSYAREPIHGLHTGALQTLFGKEVRANTPLELLVCKYEALWAREALMRVGKPGLSILGIMSGTTSEAQNGADFEGGLRPSDIHLVVFLNELKTDWDVFKKIVHNQHQGNIIDACMGGPTIGGYCGGPEGSAITLVAEIMAAYVMARPMSFSLYPVNLFSGVSSDKWTIWMSCMGSLAFKATGVDLMLARYQGGAAGPCTEMLCDEIAAQTIAHTASGYSAIYGPVGSYMNKTDYFTGMEARILCEISRATAGMSLGDANEIAKALNAGYEEAIMNKKAPEGRSFLECYDVKKLAPSTEYLGLWENKKEELAKMGLEF